MVLHLRHAQAVRNARAILKGEEGVRADCPLILSPLLKTAGQHGRIEFPAGTATSIGPCGSGTA